MLLKFLRHLISTGARTNTNAVVPLICRVLAFLRFQTTFSSLPVLSSARTNSLSRLTFWSARVGQSTCVIQEESAIDSHKQASGVPIRRLVGGSVIRRSSLRSIVTWQAILASPWAYVLNLNAARRIARSTVALRPVEEEVLDFPQEEIGRCISITSGLLLTCQRAGCANRFTEPQPQAHV